MKLHKTDIGLRITQDGEIDIYLPKIETFNNESLKAILRAIEHLEKVFTEICSNGEEDEKK